MPAILTRAAPILFVLLWSSGFVVARLVGPHAEPESFLALRFTLGAALLAAVAAIAGASWPRTARGWGNSLLTGVLLNGIYLGCAFWAVRQGLPTALASFVCSLQPLMTAALAGPLLGEQVGPRRWFGIGIGFLGASLVLVPNLAQGATASALSIGACIVAMLAITFGTIWQKRVGACVDLLAGAAIQTIGALLITLPIALATEHGVDNRPDVWIGLAWSVVVMSGITTLLLLTMIKQGAVAKVTSLFYLVPAVVALMAFAFFGETLTPLQIAGMGVATLGVFLAQ